MAGNMKPHGVVKNSTTKSMGVVKAGGRSAHVHPHGQTGAHGGFPDKHHKNVNASATVSGVPKPSISRGYTLYKKFDY